MSAGTPRIECCATAPTSAGTLPAGPKPANVRTKARRSRRASSATRSTCRCRPAKAMLRRWRCMPAKAWERSTPSSRPRQSLNASPPRCALPEGLLHLAQSSTLASTRRGAGVKRKERSGAGVAGRDAASSDWRYFAPTGRILVPPSTSDPPVVPTVGVGMHESRALQRAGWAGAASVVLLAVGVGLGYLVGVDDPGMSDAAILERLNDDARQVAAGVGMPVLAAGIALLLWFATGLRRELDRLSGGDPLAHAIVPAAALFGGLMITGVSLDVASAYAALSDEFTPDPDTVRALGMAGGGLALPGAIGGRGVVGGATPAAPQGPPPP